jgi:hypothetical protein
VTLDFGTGTRGFAAADDLEVAVCVMPGTELAFARDVACLPSGLLGWNMTTVNHRTAIFRQINKDRGGATSSGSYAARQRRGRLRRAHSNVNTCVVSLSWNQ